MRNDKEATRCKHCGKVIVGDSKLGLCDSCFNDGAGKTVGVFAGLTIVGGIVWRIIKKAGYKVIKSIRPKK